MPISSGGSPRNSEQPTTTRLRNRQRPSRPSNMPLSASSSRRSLPSTCLCRRDQDKHCRHPAKMEEVKGHIHRILSAFVLTNIQLLYIQPLPRLARCRQGRKPSDGSQFPQISLSDIPDHDVGHVVAVFPLVQAAIRQRHGPLHGHERRQRN